MGEHADMIIEGYVDEVTGVVIDGDAPGYPRRSGSGGKNRKGKRRRHRCEDCGKRFATAEGVGQHKRDKHGEKPNGGNDG